MLARDLGMTRAEMCQRMGSAEFVAWAGFYSYEHKEREAAEKKAKKRKGMGRTDGDGGDL